MKLNEGMSHTKIGSESIQEVKRKSKVPGGLRNIKKPTEPRKISAGNGGE